MALPDGLSQEMLDRMPERVQRDIEQRFLVQLDTEQLIFRLRHLANIHPTTARQLVARLGMERARRVCVSMDCFASDLAEAIVETGPDYFSDKTRSSRIQEWQETISNIEQRQQAEGERLIRWANSNRMQLQHRAMHPSGPDADECPDWEDPSSPDAQRRQLRERQRQEIARMESRHRAESQRLENELQHDAE